MKRRKHQLAAHYGYWGVEECQGDDGSVKTVISGLKKKDAEMVIGAISNAIHTFCEDNNLPTE